MNSNQLYGVMLLEDGRKIEITEGLVRDDKKRCNVSGFIIKFTEAGMSGHCAELHFTDLDAAMARYNEYKN